MNIPEKNIVHLWSASLDPNPEEAQYYRSLLSADEMTRAERLRSPIHRTRFATARGILRILLSEYTGIPAKDVVFHYTEQGKPYLEHQDIQFNLAHSHDLAIYGFSISAIGVDIEKIRDHYTDSVAKRFFSPAEYASLSGLPDAERIKAFYHIWSGKEALIKALAQGLYYALSTFSVPLKQKSRIMLENKSWHLEFFTVKPEYVSVIAVEGDVREIIYQPYCFKERGHGISQASGKLG